MNKMFVCGTEFKNSLQKTVKFRHEFLLCLFVTVRKSFCPKGTESTMVLGILVPFYSGIYQLMFTLLTIGS